MENIFISCRSPESLSTNAPICDNKLDALHVRSGHQEYPMPTVGNRIGPLWFIQHNSLNVFQPLHPINPRLRWVPTKQKKWKSQPEDLLLWRPKQRTVRFAVELVAACRAVCRHSETIRTVPCLLGYQPYWTFVKRCCSHDDVVPFCQLPDNTRFRKYLWRRTAGRRRHSCGTQRFTPNRSPTATLPASSSSPTPHAEIRQCMSQPPLCGADTAANSTVPAGSYRKHLIECIDCPPWSPACPKRFALDKKAVQTKVDWTFYTRENSINRQTTPHWAAFR